MSLSLNKTSARVKLDLITPPCFHSKVIARVCRPTARVAPTLGPGTLTLTPVLTIPIPIITYTAIQLRSSTTMKGLPLWLVAPHPVHCRSALLTSHRRLFLHTRQLLSSVSSHLSLSSALWTSSDAGEKERSAPARPRSASLKKK